MTTPTSPTITELPAAGFRYLAGSGFAFSAGVAALDGYSLTRVRFAVPPPLAGGFAMAAATMKANGVALECLCACEIRSPAPMTRADFVAFNRQYIAHLQGNGFSLGERFPIARSNMAPRYHAPLTNTLFAFTFAVPDRDKKSGGRRDFVISGKPEMAEESGTIIAAGDLSDSGLITKAAFVMEELKRRAGLLGCQWNDVTGTQVYTVRPLEPILELLAECGTTESGLTLIPGYPPVTGLDFEVDVRAITDERTL